MTQPTRLIDPQGEATPLERTLLESVLDERPSADASRRILAGTLAASGVAATAGMTSTAKAWLAAGAIAVGTAGGAATIWSMNGEPHSTSVPVESPRFTGTSHSEVSPGEPVGHDPVVPTQPPEPSEGTDAVDSTDAREHPAPRSSTPRPGRSAKSEAAKSETGRTNDVPASPSASNTASLREELALLDRARASLQAGDAQNALTLLATYDQRFPQGMLRHESRLLRKRAHERTQPSAPTRSSP